MTAITRSDDVRRQNRRLILSVLRTAGRLSRTDISGRTRLSASTVSAITSDLIGEDILREIRDTDSGSSRRGRPQVALGLNPDAAAIVAVVLSLNSLSATLINYAGEIVRTEQERLDTVRLPKEALVDAAKALVGHLIAHSSQAGMRVRRIAFAVQGITDSGSRTLLWSPITVNSDIAFADILEEAFGIPVTVENDCNMIAVALRSRDPARYRDDFIALLLSHGIGMGLILKGKIFTGTHSSGAEFGHMIHVPNGALCRCGRRGCIEAYAGNYAIWRGAHGMDEDHVPDSDIEDRDMLALAEAARSRDGPERHALQKAGEAIGYGLGSLFALVDPAPVALVGIGAAAFDILERPIREAIGRTAGGRHEASISFESFPDEMPMIREGCAMQALTFVDNEIFAAGTASAPVEGTREVA